MLVREVCAVESSSFAAAIDYENIFITKIPDLHVHVQYECKCVIYGYMYIISSHQAHLVKKRTNNSGNTFLPLV